MTIGETVNRKFTQIWETMQKQKLRFQIIAVFAFLVLAFNTYALNLSIESQQDIFKPYSANDGTKLPHASTIAQTTAGVIVAAWWAGAGERQGGTDIWMSRYINGKWTTPYRVFDGEEVGNNYTCENVMLFQPKNGPLMLFTLVGPAAYKKPGDNTTYYCNLRSYLKKSYDDGQTWSTPVALGKAPSLVGGNLIGPTKNSPVQLADGTILIPSSNEYGLLESREWHRFTFHFEKSTDGGNTWSLGYVCPIPANTEMLPIQPGFLRLGGGNLRVLGRNQGNVRNGTPTSTSSNNGQTWSGITLMTLLKHHKTAICPLTLSDGTHICIVNRYPNNTERGTLDLMTSTNGTDWSFGININPESDGYEGHYPQAVQTSDGKLHVVYTYNIKNEGTTGRIRHAIIKLE